MDRRFSRETTEKVLVISEVKCFKTRIRGMDLIK